MICELEMGKADVLEQAHAIKVLLLLRTEGEKTRTQIYRAIGVGEPVLVKRVNELRDAGLLEEHVLDVKPFSKNVQLSKVGRQVANHLAAVEEILEKD